MNIITIRTDKPEAEIGLYKKSDKLAVVAWHAHRQLAESLHTRISSLLKENNIAWDRLNGIIVYQGPGSFTGLRIGVSVSNALAYSLQIPIVGSAGPDWVQEGIAALYQGDGHKLVLPVYGAEPNITVQTS